MQPPLLTLFRLCALSRNGFNPPCVSTKEAHVLARLAVANGVAGWLLDRLDADYPDWPPTKAVRKTLLDAAHVNLSRCAAMTGVIMRISTLLRKNGIEPVILKGMALLRDYYPDIAHRSTSDIDLLASGVPATRIRDVLVSDGAEPIRTRPNWLDEVRNHLVPMRYRGLMVEVHRNLARYDVGSVSPIVNIDSHVVSAEAFSSLDAEALFCHLAIHGASHRRRTEVSLKWYVDFAQVIMSRSADPAAFVSRCLAIAPSAKSDILWAVSIAIPLLPAPVGDKLMAAGFKPVKLTLAAIDATTLRLWPLRKAFYRVQVLTLSLVEFVKRNVASIPTNVLKHSN